MTDPPRLDRHSAYATLRSAAEGEAAAQPRHDVVATPEGDDLAVETERLENVKQALYAALIAAPKAGIPTGLVDLAATYTSALRLQMSLKGYRSIPTRATTKPPSFTANRGR